MSHSQILFIANLQARCSCNTSKRYLALETIILKKIPAATIIQTAHLDDLYQNLKIYWSQGYRQFVAIGGDGSLHYLLNTLMIISVGKTEEVTIGVIPMGTGNDYIRNFETSDPLQICDQIVQQVATRVDVLALENSAGQLKFAINLSGIGFNGHVLNLTHKYKRFGGFAYYIALLEGLWTYQSSSFQIRLDDKIHQGHLFLMSVGLGRYAGNNMLLCPKALVDDGLLDVNIIEAMSKWTVIKNIFRLRDGSYLDHLPCIQARGKKITIVYSEALCEADGEPLGPGVKTFGILPRKIKFFGTPVS